MTFIKGLAYGFGVTIGCCLGFEFVGYLKNKNADEQEKMEYEEARQLGKRLYDTLTRN